MHVLRQHAHQHNVFPVKSEYAVHGGYRIDAALPDRVAVDFYGPVHFIWGTNLLTGL